MHSVGTEFIARAISAVCLWAALTSASPSVVADDRIFSEGFESCGDLALPIYAFDVSGALLRFDPTMLGGQTDPIQSLGVPDCNVGPSLPGWQGATGVVSMSVDRIGYVWALYSSGEIFKINPATVACVNTGFQPAQSADWKLFNMAFAGPTAGDPESIYVSGGSVDMASVGNLGSIDALDLTVQTLGALGGTADFSVPLAGVGTQDLYGFYPRISSTSYVRQIDRSSGAIIGTPLAVPGIGATTVSWAFAHWGGKFWFFIGNQDSPGVTTSTLQSIDLATGTSQVELGNLQVSPTSAGSSTCVPTTLN